MTTFQERFETFGPENRYPGASEHDLGGLLTPKEIIDFKNEVAEETKLIRLASWIVTDTLLEIYEEDEAGYNDPNVSYASSAPRELSGQVAQASLLGADWCLGIIKACKLPRDEWPTSTVYPSALAIWLEAMDKARNEDSDTTLA